MNIYEKKYCKILSKCLSKGIKVQGRNGLTLQLTGQQIQANLSNGFPVVTGKKVFFKSALIETEWMLKGLTNTKWLNERGVKIWDQWSDENGDLGPVYGHQLLNFNGINQLQRIIQEAKINPASRRLLCSMWNPADIDKMKLPPCHYSFQFVVSGKRADIIVSMRSLDLFVGLPYDMIMYASILESFSQELNLKSGSVIINAGSAHIYEEHIEAVKLYISSQKHKLPRLKNKSLISKFSAEDFVINNYTCQERIKVNVIK